MFIRLGCRGQMQPSSDIDLLVDFLPNARPGLLGLSAMTRELSGLLGRRVDLAVKPALKPRLRPGILSSAQLVYGA
ncbi:MAG: nucleotidyltransferase domain-containing protein [Bryobacteraceae bacterium]